ncbi:hypothetical protein L6452_02607 [Arctium lappa]|uniref:Uncharacterized protein n=1 Tax=Arctium lappa TaxID=4217 RepID=A0ACB9FJA6_ARCLA|nr:hypothetical protein L6452_02607 [Arctium lappa]
MYQYVLDLVRGMELRYGLAFYHSIKVRTSPSLIGPLTFLMIKRFWSSRNFTLACVTCPLDPVLPITFTTTACFI